MLLPESDSRVGAEPTVWRDPVVLDIEEVEGFNRPLALSRPPSPVPSPAAPLHPEPVPNSPITGTVVKRGELGAMYDDLFPTLVPSNGFCESVTPVELELWILLPPESREP